MTALAMPNIPTGTPRDTVTYPISIDYVKAWTLVRALSETVSNTIDADPTGFTVHYDTTTGELVIEDHTPNGIGVEAMVFGWSDKTGRNDVIGQFGEGLKIATIRAVADKQVSHMVIESVGVTIVPDVMDYAATTSADLNIPVKSATPPRVLVWKLYPSDRTRGTRVRVGVPRKVADEVMSRFRHITVPGYQPPTGAGTVITEPAQRGNVYIGGVLVTSRRGLVYGYDLSLQAAKRFQNRDRTVVDSYALDNAIRAILENITDADTLVPLVQAGLDGKLDRTERGFIANGYKIAGNPALKQAWEEVAARVLMDPEHCFYRTDQSDSETAARLLDDGYREIMPNGLEQWQFRTLMEALNVTAAAKARSRRTGSAVEWTRNLPADRQEALDLAVQRMRNLYGTDAVDKVRVYDRILDRSKVASCTVLGFYTPTSGQIALARETVLNDDDLWAVLFHETGHRIAHRGLLGLQPGDCADRTRGFEEALTRMGGVVVQHLVAGTDIDAITPPVAAMPHWFPNGPLAPGRRLVVLSHKDWAEESVLGDRVRGYVSVGLSAWAQQNGVPEDRGVVSAFAKRTKVTTARARSLSAGVVTVRMPYEVVKAVCLSLPGVNPAVVWWATVGMMAPWAGRGPSSRVAAFVKRLRSDAHLACGDLAADPVYADLAPVLLALADGAAEVRPVWGSDEWAAPLVELMERAESGVDAEVLSGVVARVALSGSADPREAWELFAAREG